jgi:hypothetical protein
MHVTGLKEDREAAARKQYQLITSIYFFSSFTSNQSVTCGREIVALA